jgi:hypothetical protein
MPAPIAVEKQGFGGVVFELVAGFFEIERDSGHHCYLFIVLVKCII